MLKRFNIALVLLLLVSCYNQEKPKKPDNLISKTKMESLIYDLYVINAAKGVNKKILEEKGVVPEDYFLKKHGIDSITFAESNAYYAYQPEVYGRILENVKARIKIEKTAFEDLLKEEGQKEMRKRDSIQKIKRKEKEEVVKSTPLNLN